MLGHAYKCVHLRCACSGSVGCIRGAVTTSSLLRGGGCLQIPAWSPSQLTDTFTAAAAAAAGLCVFVTHLQDNCLALVGSIKASRAVQQAAAAALLQLTRGLQQSLAAVTDPELCRSEYGDAAVAAAKAAATGKPVALDLTSCLNPPGSTAAAAAGSGPLAGFKEAAKALAAAYAPMLDPSCPNSYPQLPLPELCPDTVWRLPAGALQGAVVDVTAAVASICLQVGGWVVGAGC